MSNLAEIQPGEIQPRETLAAEIQAVTFGIGEEVFAIPVAMVREILDYQEPFRLPGTPDHVLGLISVRGEGVPTIDLRRRFGLPAQAPTPLTRILFLEVQQQGSGPLLLGLVIDRALVVSTFARERLEPAPRIGMRWNSDYITGVVREENGFVVLIDIARILTTEDTAILSAKHDLAA